MADKRIHELSVTSDKSGKFLALDEAGLPEALKFSADSLIDKAFTDSLYVKLVGNETVNGVKTWVNNGIFQAGLIVDAGGIAVTGNSHFVDKLGIGFTGTPQTGLHIKSTLSSTQIVDSTAANTYIQYDNAAAVKWYVGYTAQGSQGFGILNDIGQVKVIITNTGFVGIGDTAPTVALSIVGSGDANARIDVNRSGTGNTSIYGSDYCGTSNNTPFKFISNGTERGQFTAAGDLYLINNLGIGTNAPENNLEIGVLGSDTPGNADTGLKISRATDNTLAHAIRLTATGKDLAFDRNNSGWSEVMRIQRSTGNVGIGATTLIDSRIMVNVEDNTVYADSQSFGVNTLSRVKNSSNDTNTAAYFDIAAGGTFTSTTRLVSINVGGSATTATRFVIMLRKSGANNFLDRFTIVGETGNVGIGIASPLEKLHVAGTGAIIQMDADGTLKGATGNPNTIKLYDNSNGRMYFNTTYATSGLGGFDFQRNGTSSMLIRGDGKVGIGTVSPVYKFVVSNGGLLGLEIDPTANAGEQVTILAYNRTVAGYRKLEFAAASYEFSQGYVGIGVAVPGAALEIVGDADEDARIDITRSGTGNKSIYGSDYCGTTTNTSFRFLVNGGEKGRFTNDGYFGVGTAPATALHVSMGNTSSVVIINSTNANTYIQYQVSGAVKWYVGETGTGSTGFGFLNASGTLRVLITQTGEMGINQSTPAYQLDVKTVGTTEARVARFWNTYDSKSGGGIIIRCGLTVPGTTPGVVAIEFQDQDAGLVGTINWTSSSGLILFSAISSRKFKKNIKASKIKGIESLKAVKPRNYIFKGRTPAEEEIVKERGEDKLAVEGYIIEELEAVIPEAVAEFTGEDGKIVKGYADTALIKYLHKAILELEARLAILEP